MSSQLDAALKFGPETLASDSEKTGYLWATYSGPTWYVNPDDSNAYATINEASAEADATLESNKPIIILLAPGKTHTLVDESFSPVVNRDTRIQAVNASDGGWYQDPTTTIIGNIIQSSAAGQSVRHNFELDNVTLTGSIHFAPKWNSFFNHCALSGPFTREHGSDGSFIRMFDINMTTNWTDLDANGGGSNGTIHLFNANLNQLNASDIFTLIDGADLRVFSCRFASYVGNGGHLFDLSGGSNSIRAFNINTFKLSPANDFSLAVDCASSSFWGYGKTLFNCWTNGAGQFNFGVGMHWGDSSGRIDYSTDEDANEPEPLNPPKNHMVWYDNRTGEVLTWNGSIWITGTRYRKEMAIGISSTPAAEHDIGWNIPANCHAVKGSMKTLKTLTGAGGCTKAGLGVAGDLDKYSETSNLSVGNRVGKLNPNPSPDGGGDDLKIYATSGGGVAAGTIAGSGTEDIRLMVWYEAPIIIPS